MMDRIRQILDHAPQKGTGLLGVGFRDLATGEELYLNGDTVFPTASVFKVFVLCELFRREQEGTFSFSDCNVVCRAILTSKIIIQPRAS